jgi:DNA-binding NarL/FixJ family response regulator
VTHPEFTPVELEIGELAGRGYGHVRIGALTRRSEKTVQKCVERMAAKMDNPDDLTPLTLVQLWFAHRLWIRDRPDTQAA